MAFYLCSISFCIKQSSWVTVMPCKRADSILIKSLSVWIECGAENTFLSCGLYLLHSSERTSSSVQRQQFSFNGWGRWSLTAQLRTLWFLSPVPIRALNGMQLAITWHSNVHYIFVVSLYQVQQFSTVLYDDCRQTGLLVGILIMLYRLQGLFNAE